MRERIGQALGAAYGDCKKWEMPQRLKDLLEQLRIADPDHRPIIF
jgi:hypothetical protein